MARNVYEVPSPGVDIDVVADLLMGRIAKFKVAAPILQVILDGAPEEEVIEKVNEATRALTIGFIKGLRAQGYDIVVIDDYA